MKKNKLAIWMMLGLALSSVQTGQANDRKEKIVGKWYNPRTYTMSGEKKGFHFKRNGECKALGIKTLDLKSWKIENEMLIIEGYSISEDGERKAYRTEDKIGKLTSDSLSLVQCEKPIRLEFLYVTPKTLKH